MEDRPNNQAPDRDEHHPVSPAPPPPLRAWALQADRVAVRVDTRLYALPAVLRAAYKLTGRAYVFLSRDEDEPQDVLVTLATTDATAVPDSLIGEFANELLDQQVRQDLQAEFGRVHELIVAQAFASGNLLDPARDDGDYETDPHGIRPRR